MLSADKLIWPPTTVQCFLRNTEHSLISRHHGAKNLILTPCLELQHDCKQRRIINSLIILPPFTSRDWIRFSNTLGGVQRWNIPSAWQQVTENFFWLRTRGCGKCTSISCKTRKVHANSFLMKSTEMHSQITELFQAKCLPNMSISAEDACRLMQMYQWAPTRQNITNWGNLDHLLNKTLTFEWPQTVYVDATYTANTKIATAHTHTHIHIAWYKWRWSQHRPTPVQALLHHSQLKMICANEMSGSVWAPSVF